MIRGQLKKEKLGYTHLGFGAGVGESVQQHPHALNLLVQSGVNQRRISALHKSCFPMIKNKNCHIGQNQCTMGLHSPINSSNTSTKFSFAFWQPSTLNHQYKRSAILKHIISNKMRTRKTESAVEKHNHIWAETLTRKHPMAYIGGGLLVGAGIQQQPHTLGVTLHRGTDKRRVTVLRASAD
jgi:hypothetical protein